MRISNAKQFERIAFDRGMGRAADELYSGGACGSQFDVFTPSNTLADRVRYWETRECIRPSSREWKLSTCTGTRRTLTANNVRYRKNDGRFPATV